MPFGRRNGDGGQGFAVGAGGFAAGAGVSRARRIGCIGAALCAGIAAIPAGSEACGAGREDVFLLEEKRSDEG